MSDPILGTLAYPCSFCEAEAGQECVDGCPGTEQADEMFDELNGPGSDTWAEVIGTPPMGESMAKLAAAVHILPYGNLVGVRGMGAPDRADFDADEYIARLADWMAEYQPILRAMVDDLQQQSRDRISLQLERDIVTSYLKGTPA